MREIAPYLKSKEGQLWVLLLSALVVILLVTFVWQTADSLNLLLSGRQTVAENTEMPIAAKPAVKSIIDHPLFGQGELAGQVNTHYQLLGVLFTQNPKHRKAIIGSPTREPEIYKVDQDLKEGGKLYQVNADHILLLRNGQIEKVYLTWEGSSVGGPAKLAKPTMPGESNNETTTSVPEMSGDSEDADTQVEAEKWRDRIKELQQKYQGQMNQGQINQGASPQPNAVNPGNPNPQLMRGKLGPRMMRGGY